MIRAMSSALSGLRNHQLMLDVVGNDIANVSTVGFKSSMPVFSDLLTQTLNGAGAPTTSLGGTNPAQIGLGSRLAATVQSFTQGSLENTGRSSDLAIQGDGFFVVNTNGQQNFTRAGSFNPDATGSLTTADGGLVQGWQANAAGVIDTNQPISAVKIHVGDLLAPIQTTTANLGGNLAADAAPGAVVSQSVAAFDSQGTPVAVNLTFTKDLLIPNRWTVTATTGNPATAVALTDNVLDFDNAGELTAPADRNMNIAGGVIAGMPGAISLDLGGAATAGRVTQYSGTSTLTVTDQNGAAAGTMQSYSIGQDGVIVGNYSNGRSKSVGQVALAVFTNPGGLSRSGGSWTQTANSGLAQIGVGGQGGRGSLSAGTLEMSNVDLAEEFTRLIVAQRGFQGNARVITTADEVLQEVVNLKH
ncbi:MAG: Flagellar hook protein FlgE [Ilumatobacteraceae bacterium]|nr:Flagellar hook protein FlgE [Ilumatobacteraceae bacterium]